MAQYGWADCPAAVREQIEGYAAQVSALLGDKLLGLYLHGSLAMGCFNPTRSDIDLLAITREPLSVDERRALAEASIAFGAGQNTFELSFVPLSAINPWQHPTPYDFHYSPHWDERIKADLASGAWREWQGAESLRDPDLAAHMTITRARGITLIGKPPTEVLPDMPRADYLDSILSDFDFARDLLADNPVYAVLNFCRIVSYLTDGQIASKDEGGVWALAHFPAEYQPLIEAALKDYRGDQRGQFEADSLARFTDFIAEKIAALR